MPQDQGYSKSVDMWSIGSITAALLTGDVIFTDRAHVDYEDNPKEVILGLSATCDLSVLDHRPIWRKVSSRPKDFIRKLHVLDENRRLTATQALAHPWFTNKCHAAVFDAIYDQAVMDWRPRRKIFKTVEPIVPGITSNVGDYSIRRDLLRDAVVSRYFALPCQSPPDLTSFASSPSQQSNTPLPAIAEKLEVTNHDGQDDTPLLGLPG